MAEILMYASRSCPYCIRARWLLDRKKAPYRLIEVDARPDLRNEMIQRSGRYTVPQIWIGEVHVGGCDDLYELDREGKLDLLLGTEN